MAGMTDREKYLFDLQGFLVIKGVLDRDHVDRLNAAVDANMDKRMEAKFMDVGPHLAGKHLWGAIGGMLDWEHPWCDPFRELIVPVKLIPHLDTLLGRGWKSGYNNGTVIHAYPDTHGQALHLGEPHFSHLFHYVYTNGQMRNGLLSVQYQLVDSPPGSGGFCCIPGSHKSNFMRPEGLEFESDQPILVSPACEAGDVIIFTEGLTHGTLPWRANHERRALLWRFWPSALAPRNGLWEPVRPAWFDELTEAQQTVLMPTAETTLGRRGLIARDGSVVHVDADFDEPPMRYKVNASHLYEGPPDWIEPPVPVEARHV